MTKPARAVVLCSGALAGRITRTKTGAVFEYDDAFLAEDPSRRPPRGIAYRLPYEQPRVETHGTNVHPFFAGLLPEGFRLRTLVRRVKTSEDDLLSLLVASGADPIGDVSVIAADAEAPEVSPAVDLARLGEIRFADILAQSLAKTSGQEPTLPGVQEKVSASMLSIPIRGIAKSRRGAFLLKLNPPHAPRLVENEYFFSRMAAKAGLEMAHSEIVTDALNETGLLVQRFDRIASGATNVLRPVHQEDACQFLDRYPADKYLLSCTDIGKGIVELGDAPVVEMAKLVRLVAFSYVIANGDLHAKNVSLRTSHDDGRIELTPAYDVLSTLPYGDRTMALELDGRKDNFRRATFETFGLRFAVPAKATDAILDEICDVARSWLPRLDEIGLDPKKTADLRRVMGKRVSDLGTKSHAAKKNR